MSLLLEETMAMPPSHNQQAKRHAACDECRKRKLKCSGEATGCSRCIKQSLCCQYSLQKQMGRPPKKRTRADDEEAGPPTVSEASQWSIPDGTQFSVGPDPAALADIPHLCPQLFTVQGRNSSQSEPTPSLLAGEEDHNHTWRPDRLKNHNLPVFPSSSPWPDFSAVSEATAIPLTASTSFLDMYSLPLSPPTSNSTSNSTGPPCTCLSYLYLCLSHISSVASFPVNSQTLCSLFIAARTAQDVIRCESCPKNFATGIQNIMFTGTLLTVVADAWLRVSKTDPVDLGMQAAPPAYITRILRSADPTQDWAHWLRQIVRRAVIGGPCDADAQSQCSNQPNLLALITEIEDRQRRWHQPGQHPLWPPNGLDHDRDGSHGSHGHDECDEKSLLCVRIVGTARHVILKFNFEDHEYPDGVVPDAHIS